MGEKGKVLGNTQHNKGKQSLLPLSLWRLRRQFRHRKIADPRGAWPMAHVLYN